MCEDNNPNCNQLFQGNGAVNTIARLPENVDILFFFTFSSVDLPVELTIGILSVARIHLHA